jgi:hypothetical protein
MRWQIEGGKVLENGKHVANYSSVEAGQLQHDGAKHCPAVNDTLFFGGKPPENMTLHGAHDFDSGDEIGSVSAASSAFSAHIV